MGLVALVKFETFFISLPKIPTFSPVQQSLLPDQHYRRSSVISFLAWYPRFKSAAVAMLSMFLQLVHRVEFSQFRFGHGMEYLTFCELG